MSPRAAATPLGGSPPHDAPEPRLHTRFCLAVSVLPLFALLVQSLGSRGGSSGIANYGDALGVFGDSLFWSFKITGAVLVLDLAVCLPAAYAIVRYPVPGKRLGCSLMQLPLYVPGAVMGLSLLFTYTFAYPDRVDARAHPRPRGGVRSR